MTINQLDAQDYADDLYSLQQSIDNLLDQIGYEAAFLSNPKHRIRFVYLPKHTSWLNQIECWFSILMRRLLKRSNFTSTQDLSDRILAFIEYFNRTLAKPFEWKYEGYSEPV